MFEAIIMLESFIEYSLIKAPIIQKNLNAY